MIEVRASVIITAPDDAHADRILRALAAERDEGAEVYVSINETSRELVR